jgi:hypothetical protein
VVGKLLGEDAFGCGCQRNIWLADVSQTTTKAGSFTTHDRQFQNTPRVENLFVYFDQAKHHGAFSKLGAPHKRKETQTKLNP